MGTSGSGCMFTQSIASKSRNVKRARTKIKIKKLIKINVKTYTYKPSEFQLPRYKWRGLPAGTFFYIARL